MVGGYAGVYYFDEFQVRGAQLCAILAQFWRNYCAITAQFSDAPSIASRW